MLTFTVGLVLLEHLVYAVGDGDGVSARRRGLAPHARGRLVAQSAANVCNVFLLAHLVVTCIRGDGRIVKSYIIYIHTYIKEERNDMYIITGCMSYPVAVDGHFRPESRVLEGCVCCISMIHSSYFWGQ